MYCTTLKKCVLCNTLLFLIQHFKIIRCTQHAVDLHECNIFDKLLTDGSNSHSTQRGSMSESISDTDNGIRVAKS